MIGARLVVNTAWCVAVDAGYGLAHGLSIWGDWAVLAGQSEWFGFTGLGLPSSDSYKENSNIRRLVKPMILDRGISL